MFNNKYKERKPQETIEIIKNFFEEKGYCIDIPTNYQSESGTWSCHICLMLNGNEILNSNGKGTTEDYSIASGFAELYERFCNGIFYLNSPIVSDMVIEERYNKFGYYFDKNEKIISFEEMIESSPVFQRWLKGQTNVIDQFKVFFETLTKNKIIGVPFKSISNDSELYIDPRFLLRVNASSGMAAGNSYEEAFNQGFSEILEHHIRGEFFNNIEKREFFTIDLNNIQNKELKNIIKEIEKNNYLYIFDFSYEYNIPVLMSCAVNKYTSAITINFGAFPVFDIALERVLTELYQGGITFNNQKIISHIPYRDVSIMSHYINSSGGAYGLNTFPEEILLTHKVKTGINKKVFLTDDVKNNFEIYNYYKDLAKNLNLNVYVYNTSKSKNMTALKIFVNNLYTLTECETASKLIYEKNHIYQILLYNLKALRSIDNIDTTIDYLSKSVNSYKNRNQYEFYALGNLYFNEWFYPYEINYSSILIIIEYYLAYYSSYKENEKLLRKFIRNEKIYSFLKKNILLQRFINSKKYSKEEIKAYLTDILHIQINDEDIENINNNIYWLKKFLSELFIEPIKSNDFKQYINTLL